MPNLQPGEYVATSWGFYLDEREDGTTRLVERWQADGRPSLTNTLFYRLCLEPDAFLMERQIRLGIRRRAEKTG